MPIYNSATVPAPKITTEVGGTPLIFPNKPFLFSTHQFCCNKTDVPAISLVILRQGKHHDHL